MRPIVFRFASLLALASLLLTAACSGERGAKEQSTPTPLPIQAAAAKPTYTVARGNILAQVQFTARVIPSVQEEMFFRTDGRVRKVYVRSGEAVSKGQVLADLLQMDQMEAQKKQQDFTLRRAQINLEMAQLRQEAMATQTPQWSVNYDIQMKMQQLEVELSQIALDELQFNNQNLDETMAGAQIISPINGKVLNVHVLEGAEVRAYTPMITIGDDSQVEIGATLTSTQMQTLAEGMLANIELLSRPGDKLQGKLRSLPFPYGTGGGDSVQQKTTSVVDNTVHVALDDPGLLKNLKLGDLVTVTVVMQIKENMLWLPPQAVRTYEGRNFVVVKTEGLPRRVDVRVGIKNEEKVEILAGLEEGQIVIAP